MRARVVIGVGLLLLAGIGGYALAQAQPEIARPAPPGPCPKEGPCRPPDEWRLAFASAPKAGQITLYEVSQEHLRADEIARYAGEVSVFLLDGEVQRAKGGQWEDAAFGCQGKLPRPSFTVTDKPLDLRRGAWALVYLGEAEPAPRGAPRRIGARLKPEEQPAALQAALRAWTLPAWATGAEARDAVLPLELDGDPAPEYWVTRHYRRATHEEPAARMYSSWALLDLDGDEARFLHQENEDECDCLCRDGGCGCCRWDEISASPAALFDVDQDGYAEIVIERHARVGEYRYELWRFSAHGFTRTRLFYEDGSC